MDLLPCPFCGEADHLQAVDDDPQGHQVVCIVCGAKGPWAETRDQAIANWNRRPASTLDSGGGDAALINGRGTALPNTGSNVDARGWFGGDGGVKVNDAVSPRQPPMAPSPSCPRCGLYLHARGCTAERCANPEGAAELERLTNVEAVRTDLVDALAQEMPQRLARAAVYGPAGLSESDWGKFGPPTAGHRDISAAMAAAPETPESRAMGEAVTAGNREWAGHWTEPGEVRYQPSDLDVFRAMLERAGIRHIATVSILDGRVSTFVQPEPGGLQVRFDADGRLAVMAWVHEDDLVQAGGK